MRFFSSKSTVYLTLLAIFWFTLAVICKITVGLGLIRYAGTDTSRDVLLLLLPFLISHPLFSFYDATRSRNIYMGDSGSSRNFLFRGLWVK